MATILRRDNTIKCRMGRASFCETHHTTRRIDDGFRKRRSTHPTKNLNQDENNRVLGDVNFSALTAVSHHDG